jgi:hypothetical protein
MYGKIPKFEIVETFCKRGLPNLFYCARFFCKFGVYASNRKFRKYISVEYVSIVAVLVVA